MLPGPIHVYQCNQCPGLISYRTWVSGNTFGATLWSDGYFDTPGMLDQPQAVLCPHCHEMVWMEDLEDLGPIPGSDGFSHTPSEDDPVIPDGYRGFDLPGFSVLLAALARGSLPLDREKHLRIEAWWRGNDPRRGVENPAPISGEEKKNLSALVLLLDEDDEDTRIMKAMALKELGEFSQAEELMLYEFSEKMTQVSDMARSLIVRRDPFVRILKS